MPAPATPPASTATVADCQVLNLPKIQDPRGNLTFIEPGRPIPFVIERSYWIYDVPGGEVRGGHAYYKLQEFFIALSGSFDVVLDDGVNRRRVSLNRSYYGLYVPPMVWRRIENYSTNVVCLVLASAPYDEADYCRDYAAYLAARTGKADGGPA